MATSQHHGQTRAIVGHTWQDLYQRQALVHFPYEISTMSLFEQYSAGVPLVFPTKRFYIELIKAGVIKVVLLTRDPQRQGDLPLTTEPLPSRLEEPSQSRRHARKGVDSLGVCAWCRRGRLALVGRGDGASISSCPGTSSRSTSDTSGTASRTTAPPMTQSG